MKAFIGNSEVHQVAMLECCGVNVHEIWYLRKVLRVETLSPPQIDARTKPTEPTTIRGCRSRREWRH